MKTKAEIDRILWKLIGQKKGEAFGYWYRRLIKLNGGTNV